MKWTKQKPTKEGYYWYKDGLCNDPVIGKVEKSDGELYFDDGVELQFVVGKGIEKEKRCFWSDESIEEPK
jgi:hypothetical protein